MSARGVRVEVDGRARSVDGRDVALWRQHPAGRAEAAVDDDDARDYVAAHPRPATSGRGGTAGAQRLLALRRLAAGPATRDELRAALRGAGWLAADDLDNRLRELRELAETGVGPSLEEADGRIRLLEPFPALGATPRGALSFARALLAHTPDEMAGSAVAAVDGLVPDLARDGAVGPSRPEQSLTRQRLDAARAEQRPVRVRFWSLNSRMERTRDVLPVRYATAGTVVKVLCVPIDADGARSGNDIQLAVDRVREVEPLPGRTRPQPEAARLQRCPIRLQVTRELHDVIAERGLFDVQGRAAREVEHDVLEVEGEFPVALAWDVMEQLCAWAGVAQPLEPWWLVRAVVERLRVGLAVLETAEPFRTVKPDVRREFASLEEAVFPPDGDDGDDADADGRARRLTPRR